VRPRAASGAAAFSSSACRACSNSWFLPLDRGVLVRQQPRLLLQLLVRLLQFRRERLGLLQ